MTSQICYQAPLQMYNVIGRDIMQDQRNASIDVQTRIRDSFRPQKCEKMFESQLPFPTTPHLIQGYTAPLPFHRDHVSRVRLLEQRERQLAELPKLGRVTQVNTTVNYDIDNDPRYHVIHDNLASRQTTAMACLY